MAFKRALSLAMLCVLILFTGCGNRFSKKNGASLSPEEMFDVTPPFYKAVDESTGGTVYMLGAMHIGKEGAVYPQKIYDAIDESDVFVTEVDVEALSSDRAALDDAMSVLRCDGATARELMGSDYETIKRRFKDKGLYKSNYDSYLPTVWTTQWSKNTAVDSGYSSECGTDRVMLSYAKSRGKKVEELETAREQYMIDAGVSLPLQMYTLKKTVNAEFEDAKAEYDTLYEAWKTADEGKLRSLAEDDGALPEELKADYGSFYEAMYAARQRKMAAYIAEKLAAGEKVFVMVGALHYAAPPSIIEILGERGYEAERL